MRAGIDGVRAPRLLERALRSQDALPDGPFRVVCAGKAAMALASTIARLCEPRIVEGLVVAPAAGVRPARFDVHVGGHPVPSADSERAGRRALELAAEGGPDELLLVLLSGGASAMMAVPADGITLEDKRRTTDRLLKAGADIHALNTVRKHLSAIKGGWLAARAAGPCRTLAISDVVGDDLSVIASGPTVPDPTTFEDAIAVLQRFGGLDGYPPAVVERLGAGRRGLVPETPKAGDRRLARTASRVIGGRRDAMSAAAAEASSRGYRVTVIDEAVVGESRTAALAHLRTAMARADRARPACVVSSGETTVHVKGRGRGGRNQEFALALAEPTAALGVPLALASAGTDGIDGPTDAAGAFVDSTTLTRAEAAGLGPPEQFLADNNTYEFFAPLGDLVRTGPTDTNVGDLQVLLIGEN